MNKKVDHELYKKALDTIRMTKILLDEKKKLIEVLNNIIDTMEKKYVIQEKYIKDLENLVEVQLEMFKL